MNSLKSSSIHCFLNPSLVSGSRPLCTYLMRMQQQRQTGTRRQRRRCGGRRRREQWRSRRVRH